MTQVWRRLVSLVRRRELDLEMDEELRAHVDLAAEDYRRQGMTDAQARRAALAALGGVTSAREGHREARGVPFLETLWQDTKYALRMMRRDAGLATFAMLITGLGVGASATVFSVVDTILLRPLPFADADRLAWVQNNNSDGLSGRTIQVGHLLDMQQQLHSYSEIAGYFAFYGAGDLKMTGVGEPERLTGVPVTGNFFAMLGVPIQIGRSFTKEETQFNGPRAVILSHSYWERRFHSDPKVVGQKLILNEQATTVAGVLPADFDFGAIFAPGQRIDVFQPFPLGEQTNRWGNTMSVVGRLRPEGTIGGAQAEALIFAERMRREHSERNNLVPKTVALREYVSGSIRPAMLVLAGSVGLVMLIVCANLSNLLLARATARQNEMAIREALGAGRWRLIRQMLVESLLLAVSGGALGLAIAAGGIGGLAALDTGVPLLSTVHLDWRAGLFTLSAAVLTGVGFGLVPALRSSARVGTSRGASAGGAHTRTRSALVIAEVALACLLLVGSGLLIRSFLRVLEVDLGFQPQHAMAVRVDPGRRFANGNEKNAYFRELLRRVSGEPGVESAGLSDSLPLGKNRTWGAGAKGVSYTRDNYPLAYVRIISDGYLQAMGVRLQKGRTFAPTDGPDGAKVLIINATLAKRLWPGEDPLGKVVRVDGDRVVVGVVDDVRHLALEKEAGMEMYLPIWQTGDHSQVDLVIRGSGQRQDIEARVRGQLRALDPTLPLAAFRPLEDLVNRAVSPRRLIVTILGGFAAFALLLAMLGIYGVISYSVTQRRKEIGIRMAMGASGPMVQRGILLQTLQLAGIGLVAGVAASWGAMRVLSGMVFGVTITDPLTFGLAVGALLLVAVAAGYLPAVRASRMNPVEALRME